MNPISSKFQPTNIPLKKETCSSKFYKCNSQCETEYKLIKQKNEDRKVNNYS